ncbi:hypothetical protein EG68_02472 [Paragonimus skrjabini miyazakii]|uniref:Uncharacterized protein n=1 Tax=Paragonimus skrjabini miyazakii TaxID=59628 RepID=A0A8S9Z467_9TREM|nr:hypothetical protein EG68_02472 [Paragonimus skrjabini miyazakii]
MRHSILPCTVNSLKNGNGECECEWQPLSAALKVRFFINVVHWLMKIRKTRREVQDGARNQLLLSDWTLRGILNQSTLTNYFVQILDEYLRLSTTT